jgi:hypothetical protein
LAQEDAPDGTFQEKIERPAILGGHSEPAAGNQECGGCGQERFVVRDMLDNVAKEYGVKRRAAGQGRKRVGRQEQAAPGNSFDAGQKGGSAQGFGAHVHAYSRLSASSGRFHREMPCAATEIQETLSAKVTEQFPKQGVFYPAIGEFLLSPRSREYGLRVRGGQPMVGRVV